MRYIFIVLFLVSFGSVSMGGVGDVYYYETVKIISNAHEKNEITEYENMKFKFKINSRDEIILGTSVSINNPFGV